MSEYTTYVLKEEISLEDVNLLFANGYFESLNEFQLDLIRYSRVELSWNVDPTYQLKELSKLLKKTLVLVVRSSIKEHDDILIIKDDVDERFTMVKSKSPAELHSNHTRQDLLALCFTVGDYEKFTLIQEEEFDRKVSHTYHYVDFRWTHFFDDQAVFFFEGYMDCILMYRDEVYKVPMWFIEFLQTGEI